nr:DNA methyltransferase [Sediminimonas sp.]
MRIVFCLFADDTGIFQPKDILWEYLENRTQPDGSDTGPLLAQLFDVLNTPEDARSPHLDEDLAKFPYVNGALFAEYFPPPVFNAAMRAALLNACRFDWTPISPAIFGSLFQSVMDPAERRAKGAHYTTEQNILKVIEPLFMDDLRAEFDRLRVLKRDKRRRLTAFQEKLAGLTFFDPACGCGNFLIIAYRELRLLELELLRELNPRGQRELDATILSLIDVNQFYGIEYEEFPARIAETALWMMDHIMNNRLSLEFGEVFTRIPLRQSPTIVHGDALETEWRAVLPPERCSYLLGNPPFVGAKYQSPQQREQVRRIADLGKSGGTLDYVCAWFIKAGEYAGRAAAGDGARPTGAARNAPALGAGGRVPSLRDGGKECPRIGFVSTNSITQGEQVAQLWPVLFDQCGLEIAFAHRTFPWGSEARGKANVHVVIIGLDRRENAQAERRLFSYPDPKGAPEETCHRAISPYLFDAGGLSDPHLVVREQSRPINGLQRVFSGSQPIDDGNYVLDEESRNQLLGAEPKASAYLKPYLAARDFLQGGSRWVLYLSNASPADLRHMPEIRRRIAAVREYRQRSKRKSTKSAADYPAQFSFELVPDKDFLVLPKVSSERRHYMPIGFYSPPVIPSDLVFVRPEATLSDFALLTSAMHMAWLRQIGGRLKSDFRYSIGLVYNTFPLPKGDLSKLEPHAKAVLDARAQHPGATLADLYDPDLMPADLRRAHGALDKAVDRLYRRSGFASDRERVEHLFQLYERMVKPLLARPKRRR